MTEQPFCADCVVCLVEEVHHIEHRANLERFFERDNLMGLCHACHAARTRRGE